MIINFSEIIMNYLYAIDMRERCTTPEEDIQNKENVELWAGMMEEYVHAMVK
jgi:hypothetical protein